MLSNPMISWRANSHDDGTSLDGWFIAGMHLDSGDISYHLPIALWAFLDGSAIETMLCAPKWDGHTPDDVVDRLVDEYCRQSPWADPNEPKEKQ